MATRRPGEARGLHTVPGGRGFPTFAVTAVSGTCTVASPIAVSSSTHAHVEGWFKGRDVGVAVNGAHVTATYANGPLVTTQGA